MSSPLVTIGIPFYNSGKYLEYSIFSVLNQTYNNFELILLDDGSDDDSLTIANSFKDDRIIVLSDSLNKGLPYRLNMLTKLAKGKYYARMDADDIMTTDRIEIQVKFLEDHPEVDVLGSSAMIIDDKNRIVRSANMEGVTTGFMHPTVMGKTSWFLNNPYDESLKRSQDLDLWLKSANHSVFQNILRPLLFYREFGVPSLRKNLNSQKALRVIYMRYKDYRKPYTWFLRNIITSYVKVLVYILLTVTNQQKRWMMLRKRRPLPDHILLNDIDLKKSIAKND